MKKYVTSCMIEDSTKLPYITLEKKASSCVMMIPSYLYIQLHVLQVYMDGTLKCALCMCNTFRVNKHAKQTLTIKTIAIGTDEIYLAMLEVQK